MAEPMAAARARLGLTPANVYESIPLDVRFGAIPKAARGRGRGGR